MQMLHQLLAARAALLILGSAVIVRSQPTIYPSKDIYLREGSPFTFSCSFPRPGVTRFALSVDGSNPWDSELVVSGIKADVLNKSQALGVLGFSFIVQLITTSRANIEFTFYANRTFDGYTLQCFSKRWDIDDANETVSQSIMVHVEYPPSPSAKNETVHVFLSQQPTSFQLNCSDLLTGNPLPNVTWTNYDMNWKFSVTPTGPQNSLLLFQIDSLDTVPASLYLDTVAIVCTASNKVGSAAREITLNVSGTPSAPQQVGCTAATGSSSCIVKCTWNTPVISGSSNIISFDLLIKTSTQEVIYNKTVDGVLTEHSISEPSAFNKPNEELEVYITAVSGLGPGLESSTTFISPGPCMKPLLGEVGVNQTFARVIWITPDCNNLPVNTFNVAAFSLNGTNVFIRNVDSHHYVTSLLIGPLSPGTMYKVYVTSINCAGRSDPGELNVTTMSAKPLAPPLAPVFVSGKSSSSKCLQNLNVLLCFVFLRFLVTK